MTDIKKKKKKKKKKNLEFHGFRFKSAIPRIPRLFRDRGKSLALHLNEVMHTATDGRNGLFAPPLSRLRFAAIRGDLLISDTR